MPPPVRAAFVFTKSDADDPDDFGSYAWRNQYFGLNNLLVAGLLDPDGDGQTNAFELTVGVIPSDPSSCLTLAPVPGQPARKKVVFTPRLPNRTYTDTSRPTPPHRRITARSEGSPI